MQKPNTKAPLSIGPEKVRRLEVTSLPESIGATAPVLNSVDLPGDRAFPESITSTRDGTLFTGSVASGGIVRIRPNSPPETWIEPGAFGTGSTLGVLADESSDTLWVCSNDLSAMGLNIPGAMPGSALKGFSLNTGMGKISASLPGDKTLCNDIAIGPDGSVYVTNSVAPQILRLRPGDKEFTVWFSDAALQPPGGQVGLDGLAFGSDGNLYFDRFDPADLYRVDVSDGRPVNLTKLNLSRSLVLADAIRPLGRNTFLLIEGGGRLDKVRIDGDTAVIETIRDGFAGPTGVTRVRDIAWVSEGQLPYLFDPSKKGQKPNLPFRLFAVPIPK